MMLSVYCRKEPTTCELTRTTMPEVLKYPWGRDVVAYEDAECTKPKARFVWDASSKPDRRNKRVNLNCATYNIVWLPDLEESK